ncbi:MAG: serine dehydratase subunit alpha family protein [Desulfurella sp.]|jgi:L-cysteine desulfidase|uniref:L-cysteine desulfidase family protein n=2 Tax=Desulfurella sp. TaxID=1962857 RepID=UPI003C990AE0
MNKYDIILEILKDSVKPALGCTEPGAVAFAVSRSKEILGEDILKLTLSVDKNILKNGMFVTIPGTNEKGLLFAAALAIACGRPEYGLEALKEVSSNDIQKAREIIKGNVVDLILKKDAEGLFIKAQAQGRFHNSTVIIMGKHDNIVFESKDETVIKSHLQNSKSLNISELKNFSISELVDFANSIDIEKIEFLYDGIQMNRKIAQSGLNENVGIGFGKFVMSKASDAESLAIALTVSASEARMSGYALPVTSSAGSGNHGLLAIIPISIIGEKEGFDRDEILRALALSHLLTAYVKAYTGVLSSLCGCGIAAGVGCSAGLTYLREKSITKIENSIKNVLAGLSGMICDGAKIGCAYKLYLSSISAIEASNMALNGIVVPSDNGILAESAKKCIENLGRLSNQAMKDADDTILDIMLKKFY